MDWTLAIRRNREALERVLAGLFALIGMESRHSAIGISQPGSNSTPNGARSHCLLPSADCPVLLPRHLHTHALRILRAAEAAIRRLIVIAAREVRVKLPQPSSPPPCGEVGGHQAAGWGSLQGHSHNPTLRVDLPTDRLRLPAFPLLDPLKRHSFEPPRRASKFMPRICVLGVSEPAPLPDKPVPSPDDPISAAGLCRRLLSSRRALTDLPREARRFARWRARRGIGRRPGRVSPLRLGRPPGSRRRSRHAVNDILKECHALALDVLAPPDTS